MTVTSLKPSLVQGTAPAQARSQFAQNVEQLEYSALKQEQAARIGLRENALYANIAVSASVITLFFQPGFKFPKELLQVLPFISGIMFWIYFNNDHYVNLIGRYISTELEKRLVETSTEHSANPTRSAFHWEEYHRIPTMARWVRKTIAVGVLFVSFLALPVFALKESSDFAIVSIWVPTMWFAGLVATFLILTGIIKLSE